MSTILSRCWNVPVRYYMYISRLGKWPWHITKKRRQCCGSGMIIQDPNFCHLWSEYFYPGSRVKKIPDAVSASKNLSVFNPKIVSKLSEKWYGKFIPDPVFSIPDPGSATLKKEYFSFTVHKTSDYTVPGTLQRARGSKQTDVCKNYKMKRKVFSSLPAKIKEI